MRMTCKLTKTAWTNIRTGDIMIKKAQFLRGLILLSVAVLVLSFVASAAGKDSALSAKSLKSGAKWVVDKTTELSSLTVPEDATIAASKGHSLTLTVDGVDTAIKPGTYHGKIVLTVADDIPVASGGPPGPPVSLRTALYINDGKIRPEKSVLAAVKDGQVTDTEAKNISITSKSEKFNGIIVDGDSKFTLSDSTINFDGMGGGDSIGAAIVATGKADLTLNHDTIISKGAIRSDLFVSGHATVHVNDSTIEAYNGIVPAGAKADSPMGIGVPWMLGLNGNVRATNVIENGTVYYNNSHFKSQGWGVLSTDGPTHIRMYVTNSTIDNLESGYGAFTIGDCFDTFSHDTFNVVDVGLIVTGFGSALITDGTVINSRRFGLMMHTNDGKFGSITVNKGSQINSRSTAFEIKGRGVKIEVDDAKIFPGNGILIEAIQGDDPYVGGFGTKAKHDAVLDGTPGSEEVISTSAGSVSSVTEAPGAPGAAPAPGAPGAAGGPGGGAPGAAPAPMDGGFGPADLNDSGGKMSGPVIATFKNVTLNGDIVNARTFQGGMEISLEKASLTGAITTANAVLAAHQTPTGGPTKEIYYMMGEVKNIYAPTNERYGLKVSVDGASQWVVDQTSYLTELNVAEGAAISAPQGFSLSMTVEGVTAPIKAGAYKGKIVLRVVPGA
jgi:hypothetical protein